MLVSTLIQKTVPGILLGGLILFASVVRAQPPDVSVDVLLEADQTILGEDFTYPEGPPKITMAVITVPPHATIGLHEHPVPLVAYILQGELVVVYQDVGEIRYRSGDAFVEAFEFPHRAFNGGRGQVKILAVYAGAEGVPNSVLLD